MTEPGSPRALPALTIPNAPEELTATWLTSALRTRGALGAARVRDFSTEELGQGEGFIGTIVRISLDLDGAEANAPRSVIGKFPTTVAENRRAGEALGVYEREIRFYQEFAHALPLETPTLYYADLDPSGIEGREEKIFGFMDRFPIWLIRLLTPAVQWIAGRSKRRYVLLIEDLAPALPGDQVKGCGAETARELLAPLARMHAAYWEKTRAPEFSWVPRFELMRRWFHETFRDNGAAFVESHGDTLPRTCALRPWLDAHAVELIERLADAPYTLLHGDYRLDNMVTRRDPDGALVPTVFDWQTPLRGPAGVELSYFVSGNLTTEVALEAQDELIAFYQHELARHGIDYPLSHLFRDYQLGLLWGAWRMILGIDQLDFTNERGRMLIELWMKRLDALLPDDPDRVLAASAGSLRQR